MVGKKSTFLPHFQLSDFRIDQQQDAVWCQRKSFPLEKKLFIGIEQNNNTRNFSLKVLTLIAPSNAI
jgi:hypothetical protein